MKSKRSYGCLLAIIAIGIAAGTPARANILINPTWDASINSDPNAAAIKATINLAISIYEQRLLDPITVDILFKEDSSISLGQSNFSLFEVPYSAFHGALIADGKTGDDAAALARLAIDGSGAINPVTGTTNILMKSANIKALGGTSTGSDGTISFNTNKTTPGSPGTSAQFSLLSVAEHEIDEILGLGSTLGLGLPSPYNNEPSPEDFFRFNGSGSRSFTPVASATAFFSINGTTNLAQFNQGGGGDYGDWKTGAGPVRVQDAFATVGANPTIINNVELRALDVIGYDVVPEPGTGVLLAGALALAGLARRRFAAR